MSSILRKAKVEQYRATFEFPFNQKPEDIVTDKGSKLIFPNPSPINVPPDLPGFYGWLDTETLDYYKPGQEHYPTKNSHYRGVFNVGRPISMQIKNDRGQEYSIFFTSFWHNDVVINEAPPFTSDPPADSAVYIVSIFVPQLEDTDGYAFELELLDVNDNFISLSVPALSTSQDQSRRDPPDKGRDTSDKEWQFGTELGLKYVDIWHLKYGCKLRLTYQLTEVWCESF